MGQSDHNDEILQYMSTLRQALHDVISEACDGTPALAPAQIKELLKLALTAARQTRRISPSDLSTIWEPSIWLTLADRLAGSERFKSSTNLKSMCKQMAQTTGQVPAEAKGRNAHGETSNATTTIKRKIDTVDGDEGAAVKSKRKKVRKHKS